MGRRRFFVAMGAIGALLIVLGAAWFARRFYYAAMDMGGHGIAVSSLGHPEETGIEGIMPASFPSRNGTAMSAWYVPSRNRAGIVISTGTNANRATMLPEIRILAAAGFGVLAFDWPGTGLSGGKVDWGNGAAAALEGAVDWLTHRPDVDSQKVGAFGFSGGGFVTAHVAAEDTRIRAVVLSGTRPGDDESAAWFHAGREHPLKDMPGEWAARWYGWPVGLQLPKDYVGRLSPRPVLIISGSEDPFATPARSAKLYAAAKSPKDLWIAPGASHGEYAVAAPEKFTGRVVAFYRRGLNVMNPDDVAQGKAAVSSD